jgi:hypothetical protein
MHMQPSEKVAMALLGREYPEQEDRFNRTICIPR